MFGIRKSADTRAALRFFSERRIKTHFVEAAQLTDTRWLEKLEAEPQLLRLPLVRYRNAVTIGAAPETWKQWCGQ